MVVTRCPDCHARFRVTDGQLKLARGQVRCGACLSVFDARAHAIEDTPPLAATTPTKPDPAPVAPKQSAPALRARPASTDTPHQEPEPVQAAAATTAGQIPFRAEPLAFSRSDSDNNPVVTTGWLLIGLAALLGLFAQLLWFERADMARYVELRSIYALLCHRVDCSLDYSYPSLVSNQGLHLQQHPQFSDALKATILLENRAAFSQPWPGLHLVFTDLKGRLVAQRTFQPSEYLDTDAMDVRRMPSGQPMQVELELADPGRRGVNYELRLVPALPPSAK
ncbi:DUF3426 domain-containing protein [Marinobacterium weihaiense]|uniref:DUF3426 domain-containing protein n=1 Tax=Marinobacterium weihaiense TaxID=2851016 RepID=A0ABS6MB54_9GAMM|nr:DUF3426 domain-containing protein [Marinobacterium weihaiense]MBV0933509.1 DUF3426 domain-containing protein [Marinobacterium weihaiense]